MMSRKWLAPAWASLWLALAVTPVFAAMPTHPALKVTTLDGQSWNLSAQRGHWVIVNFWATWCVPCLKELPALDAAQAKFGENGAIVLGIAMDESARVRVFLADHPLRFPILLGRTEPPSTSLVFGDRHEVLPYSVLIGTDGRVIATRRGPLDTATLSHWLGMPGAPGPHTATHGE